MHSYYCKVRMAFWSPCPDVSKITEHETVQRFSIYDDCGNFVIYLIGDTKLFSDVPIDQKTIIRIG